MVELLKILWCLADNHTRAGVMIASSFGLVGQGHVFMVLFCNCRIGVVSRGFHELVLRIQNVDILEILTRLLNQSWLALRPTSSEIGMLGNLALCFMSILEVRLGACNTVFRLVRWIHIDHLYLAFRMADGSLLVLTGTAYFLAAIGPFLPLLQVASVYYLLLISLEDLCRVCRIWTRSVAAKASLIVIIHLLLRFHVPDIVLWILLVVSFVIYHLRGIVQHFWTSMITLENHCTTGSFFETNTSMLGLLTQCYSILCLINLMVHLTTFITTIDVHRVGTAANLVICVVVLHIHSISTHCWLWLVLHVSFKLLELLLATSWWLMISMSWVRSVLATCRPIFSFLTF